MKGRRNPFIAREGIPFIIASIVVAAITFNLLDPVWTLLPILALVWIFLVFRDPRRKVPAAPLGVVCPVDGTVTAVGQTGDGVEDSQAHRILIKINSLGTYTSRCPVEGKIMDFAAVQSKLELRHRSSGLWVRTDENDDVVLSFHGYRFGLAPRAFLRYGERVGQGQRCAYLRLTRMAEVQLPINGRVLVTPGQEVSAGTDLLAKLPHP